MYQKFVIVALLLSLALSAQDSLNVRFVGGYPFGIGRGSWGNSGRLVSGNINNHNYLFCASGCGIIILNIDEPSNPVKVGNILKPYELIPYLQDTLLYAVANNYGLQIFNVKDPSNPFVVGSCPCPPGTWTLWHICVQDSFAYVTSPNRLTIFNVKDPTNPVVVGFWQPPPDTFLLFVSVKGDYAYVTGKEPYYADFLFIINISNPVDPTFTGGCFAGDGIPIIYGNYAYIACGGLEIIDVSDPTNPFFVSGYPGGVINVSIVGNYAYCSGISPQFSILDISNPQSPFLVGEMEEERHSLFGIITVLNQVAYYTNYSGVSIVDVSEPQFPFKIAEYSIISDVERLEISDTIAIASSGRITTISTINIADSQNCFELDNFRIQSWYPTYDKFCEIDVKDNYVYAGTYDSDLVVLDIADPYNIQEVAHCEIPGWAPIYDLFVKGNYLYVANGNNYEFGIIDISNPLNPFLISGIPYADTFQIFKIFVVDSFAYCAAKTGGGCGLKIIDVSDPYHPYPVVNCSLTTAYCSYVYISGNYAYLTGDNLYIVDISDPYHPFVIHQYPYISGLYVVGNYLYGGGVGGLEIYDISDPTNFVRVGNYWTPFIEIHDIVVSGNYIYAATGDNGLWILEFYGAGIEEKEGFIVSKEKLMVKTIGREIEFSYSLQKNSMVKISLLDVCGRLVKKNTIYEAPGNYTKSLNDANISSGIYFLRLETDEWTITKKIILLK